MNVVKTNWKRYFIFLLLSFVTIFLFASSTSPLYGLFYSNYSGHQAAANFVLVNGWIKGYLPYKDLVLNDGPLFYLLEMIGWFVGKRFGIFVLEIINLFVSLLFMDKLMMRFVSQKRSFAFTLFMLVPFVATLSGGNASEEWVLTLSIVLFYIILRSIDEDKNYYYLISGIILGAVLMIKVTAGGMIYGLIIFILIYQIKKRGFRSFIPLLSLLLVGTIIVILPFVIYFMINNGLEDMMAAAFGSNLYVNFSDKTVLLHMIIKSVPVLFMILTGVVYLSKSKNCIGYMVIFGGLGLFITLLLGEIDWYKYIPMSICIPLIFAIVNNFPITISRIFIIANIICMIGIYFLPLKNFVSYIVNEDQTTYQELVLALKDYQKKTGEEQFMMMNMPASIYLETDTIPDYRYFAKQEYFIDRNEILGEEMYTYFSEKSQDKILILKATGFMSEHIGNYELVDMYFQGRTVYAIYEYLPEAEEE